MVESRAEFKQFKQSDVSIVTEFFRFNFLKIHR